MRKGQSRSVLVVAGWLLIACAGAFAQVQTYSRNVCPVGNGCGIASICDTQPVGGGDYSTLRVAGSGVCSAFASGSERRVNGALLDTAPKIKHIVGFHFTFDPASPDTLSVWRNCIAENGTSKPCISSFGYGGVTHETGLLSIHVDGYDGGDIAGHGLGAIAVDSPTTITFAGYSNTPGFTLLGGGDACSDWSVPDTGENAGMLVSNFDQVEMARLRDDFVGSGVCLSPHGVALTTAAIAHKGSAAINDTAHVIAQITGAEPGETPMRGEWFRMRVIEYADTGGYTEVSQHSYSFREIGDGRTFAFANYFYQTAFRGPRQISINDHGDIAFPVVINVEGNLYDNSPYKLAKRRGVLFMSHLSPGVFRCVVDNATDGPALFYDYEDSDPYQEYAPCIGGVAIDNDCNVYFSGTSWMGYWEGELVTTNAIYKATADTPGNPNSWRVEPIAWTGMQWRDGDDVCELSLLPVGIDDSEWFADEAAFCCQGISRTALPAVSGPLASVGGLFFGAGVHIAGSAPGVMRGLYLAPTGRQPEASDVAQAVLLADGEPVNLFNCHVTDYLGSCVDPFDSHTYYLYRVADESGSMMIRTIRTADAAALGHLKVGDRVHVSGRLAHDPEPPIAGQYLDCTGLVQLNPKIVGMTNRALVGPSTGSGQGTSTLRQAQGSGGLSPAGRWVKVWGVVSNLDTEQKTFTIDDGSGCPVAVNYNGANDIYSVITVPQDGDYVSVSGIATPLLPPLPRGDERGCAVTIYDGGGVAIHQH